MEQIIEAHISLTDRGFHAELSDGQRIERGDIDTLAAALHAAGVTAETAHCGDWRNGEHVLGAGQQIALKNALYRLVNYDPILRAAKDESQGRSRALVREGVRKPEDNFFISPEIARTLKIRHRTDEF